MTQFWSGAGCEANADYVFDHVSKSGIRMFRKVAPPRYIGDTLNGSGRPVPVCKGAGTTPQTSNKGVATMFDVHKAVASVDDAIETLAQVEYPDVSKAQAVACFLGTPAGGNLYNLRNSMAAVRKSVSVDPWYLAVEVIADGLIARGMSAPEAFSKAFNQIARDKI